MGFFDLFVNKNPNVLNRDEQEAAVILKDILQSYKNGDAPFGSDEVIKLAAGLYYLSFRRTGKKVIRIENFIDEEAIFSGNMKGLDYASVFETIKQTIENACKRQSSLSHDITLQDYEKAILATLKIAAKRIAEI